MITRLLLVGAAVLAQARAQQSVRAADLATNDTFQLSYEGSWSFRVLDPSTAPLDTGAIGYNAYSDWSPGGRHGHPHPLNPPPQHSL